MHLLVSLSAAKEFMVKQRVAIKIETTWHLATILEIRRKYVSVKFDDGDTGEFDKTEDAAVVKILPKGIKKHKAPLKLKELKELISEAETPKLDKIERKVQKPVIPAAKTTGGKKIQITLKPVVVPALDKHAKPVEVPHPVATPTQAVKKPSTLKTQLKIHNDKPIHPMDLNAGMVVQVARDAQLFTMLLLEYNATTHKWSAVQLRENANLVLIPSNQIFTHNGPLSSSQKLWEHKYMFRLNKMKEGMF